MINLRMGFLPLVAKRSDANGVRVLTYASLKSPALREMARIVYPLGRATESSMPAYYQGYLADSISSFRLIY